MNKESYKNVVSDSRTSFSIVFLSIFAMVITGHITGRAYPGLVLFLFLGVVGLLIAVAGGQSLYTTITCAAILAIGYRVYSLVIPATLIGDDPNSNLVWLNRMLEAGSIEPIGSGFYADAPFYYIYATISSLIFSVSPSESVLIYPIAVGAILPLIVVSISRLVGIEHIQLLGIGAILAPITTEAVRRSYWPIAQTQTSIFWWLFLLVLIWHLRNPSKRFYGLLAFFTVSMAYSHKIPLPIIALLLIIMMIIFVIDNRSLGENSSSMPIHQISGVLSLSIVIMIGQWLYASDLINQITHRLGQFVVGLAALSAPAGDTDVHVPTSAVPARPGILADIYQYPIEYSLYFERSHAIILLLVSGAGWLTLYVATRDAEERSSIQVLLASSAICVFLIMLGQVSVGAMNPTRPLLLIEPILVILIISLIHQALPYLEPRKDEIRSGLLYTGIILLAASQIFAASAAADYPNTPRYYLDEPESEATETLCTYGDDEVYVDQEVAAFTHCTKFDRISRSNDDPLYNAEIEPSEHGTVLYRHTVDVYLGEYDRWRLTWEPGVELPKDYHTVYDNGTTSAYNSSGV